MQSRQKVIESNQVRFFEHIFATTPLAGQIAELDALFEGADDGDSGQEVEDEEDGTEDEWWDAEDGEDADQAERKRHIAAPEPQVVDRVNRDLRFAAPGPAMQPVAEGERRTRRPVNCLGFAHHAYLDPDMSDGEDYAEAEDVQVTAFALIASRVDDSPSYTSALAGEDRERWLAAIATELEQLKAMGTFSEPRRPPASWETGYTFEMGAGGET